jgi:hypothetical protein
MDKIILSEEKIKQLEDKYDFEFEKIQAVRCPIGDGLYIFTKKGHHMQVRYSPKWLGSGFSGVRINRNPNDIVLQPNKCMCLGFRCHARG